jgi:hypothetical protein
MYRRRRPHGEQIAFGFDCFLDLVTNLIGILVRLILVAWVGARSYRTTMKWVEEPAAPAAAAPQVTDDPMHAELQRAQQELNEARARLLAQLDELTGNRQRADQARSQLALLDERRRAIEAAAGQAGDERARRDGVVRQAALSMDELRRRSKELLKEIKDVEAQGPRTKVLRYHAPVSRTVYDDQIRFECRGGRVTYIDMNAMVHELQADMDERIRELRSQWSVTNTTGPVGAFRLRYTLFRRDKDALGQQRPSPQAGFRLDYRFVVEPVTAQRGETLTTALTPGSDFRQLVDKLDPRLTVVTFHVYPDSYAMFRQLRDYLYERDIEVAGMPQPEGEPITFSPHGVMSRGQ